MRRIEEFSTSAPSDDTKNVYQESDKRARIEWPDDMPVSDLDHFDSWMDGLKRKIRATVMMKSAPPSPSPMREAINKAMP